MCGSTTKETFSSGFDNILACSVIVDKYISKRVALSLQPQPSWFAAVNRLPKHHQTNVNMLMEVIMAQGVGSQREAVQCGFSVAGWGAGAAVEQSRPGIHELHSKLCKGRYIGGYVWNHYRG